MRIQEFTRKNVVFVGIETGGVFTPLGTGFFGAVTVKDSDFAFLITANHVIDDITGDAIAVRLNRRSGECETAKISKSKRITHTNPNNDLAIFSVPFGSDVYDNNAIPLNRDHLEAGQNFWAPGLGDEVATVGLYTSHYGYSKNIPIVRIGNIAALPEEPVRTGTGYVSAYLVETRSIAGLSGSPVYLNVPHVRVVKNSPEFLTEPVMYPIGVMIGYHVVESKEDQIAAPRFQDNKARNASALSPDERNTGFAVVVPFERIIEIMERQDVVTVINRSREHHLKNSGFRPASAAPETTPIKADNPQHKEDFTSLLDAATRGNKPTDQT